MADILVSMILFGREEYPHRKFCNSTFHIFTVNTIWNPFLLNNRGFKDQQLYNTWTWEHFFLLSLSNQNLFKRNHIKKFHENTFQLFYYTIECYLENVMWNVAVNKKKTFYILVDLMLHSIAYLILQNLALHLLNTKADALTF